LGTVKKSGDKIMVDVKAHDRSNLKVGDWVTESNRLIGLIGSGKIIKINGEYVTIYDPGLKNSWIANIKNIEKMRPQETKKSKLDSRGIKMYNIFNEFKNYSTVSQDRVYIFISKTYPRLSGTTQAKMGNLVLTKLAESGVNVI
jgi:hypothetical protein